MMEEGEYRPRVLPEFKYYKGEGSEFEDCPFERDDVRSRFWWGERMFVSLDTEETFKGYAADVVEWCKWLKEHKPNQAARMLRENTDRQLAVAFYIVLLYGKWCPYGSDDFIFDY